MTLPNNNNTLEKRFPLISILRGIGPLSYESPISASIISKHFEFINSKVDAFPNIHGYFNSKLHDSKINSVLIDSNVLSISLNDFSTNCFFSALLEFTNMPITHIRYIFPVILNFYGLKYYSLSYINRNNKLIQLNSSRYLYKISTYLYDQVLALEPDSVSLAILFWSTFSFRKRYLLLQVKCNTLLIKEPQRDEFIRLVGDKFIHLYDKYWRHRCKGVIFDYRKAVQFIAENL